jgi:hypothetical protein
MPALIVITILIVVTVLIAKSVYDAQQKTDRPERHAGGRPASLPRPRPRAPRQPRKPAPPPVDEAALADHVAKLRDAVGQDLISTDEAAESVVRFTEGALSTEAARELIHRQDAA